MFALTEILLLLETTKSCGLMAELSSNVRTCFTNCTQFMLQLVLTAHPVYTLLYRAKLKICTMIFPWPSAVTTEYITGKWKVPTRFMNSTSGTVLPRTPT